MSSDNPKNDSLEKLHILVADDSNSIRNLIKGVLSSSGFRNVTTAKDGYDACRLLKSEEKFDLMICDWDMPNMSGMELLKNIRSNKEHQNIPFVMLTGFIDSGKVKLAIEAGVDDYIIKPINPQKLLISILKLIKRKGLV